MNKKITTLTALTCTTLFLTGCNGFFDKDNLPTPTPLVAFKAEIQPKQLWSAAVGSGSDSISLKMAPIIAGDAIFTSSRNGIVQATNKWNGRSIWSTNVKLTLTSGPGVGNGIVVVCSNKGEVVALAQATGKVIWKQNVDGEIFANPAVSSDTVVIKTIDGTVTGISAQDGMKRWTYQQAEPALILRDASTPLINNNATVIGFANGHLAKLNSRSGQLIWQQIVALPAGGFSIDRMVDIDVNPVYAQNTLFAATYQGNIAAYDWATGREEWTHSISSYTGMAIANQTAYITDAQGYVWAFATENGAVKWKQTKLAARFISGPAAFGRYVIVGDQQGFIHWLDQNDGHFVARVGVNAPIVASPLIDENRVYIYTSKGRLFAYTLS